MQYKFDGEIINLKLSTARVKDADGEVTATPKLVLTIEAIDENARVGIARLAALQGKDVTIQISGDVTPINVEEPQQEPTELRHFGAQ